MYLPLTVEGERQYHVCAFERSDNDSSILVVAPRFFSRLITSTDELPCGAVWGSTCLFLSFDPPGTEYRNIFTGELVTAVLHDGRTGIMLAEILESFPVALMERLTGSS